MDTRVQIKKFEDFIEKFYHKDLRQAFSNGDSSLVVDFFDLAQFSPDLAQWLLDFPADTLKAAEIAIENFDPPQDAEKFHLRIRNLPSSQKLNIRHKRGRHIGKMYFFHGRIRQKSDVRPRITSTKFECPSCGNIIPLLQLEDKFREPSKCNACGRKGKFRILSSEMVDSQRMVLEECMEDIGQSQPKRLNVILKNDLTTPVTDERTAPGSKIMITGILLESPIYDGRAKTTELEFLLEANYVQPLEDDYTTLKITPEEEQEIKDIAKDPQAWDKLVSSVVPHIHGHDQVKQAVLLQLLGGVMKNHSTGRSRGDTHILIIGDPGKGKSQILKRVAQISPRGKYVSGKSTSAAGLTAAVIKDNFLGGFMLEAGAMVMANGGHCCVDELDKMGADDRSAMHEALEDQTVTISKAQVQASLRCETTVLAAANPKNSRFDEYETISKNIGLPASLVNRFDLIFPVRDIPDEQADTHLAEFITDKHRKRSEPLEGPIETSLLRKYIAYTRITCQPKLTEQATKEIVKYYVGARKSTKSSQSIAISARQLEGLVRLAEASAKVRHSEDVTEEDAQKAIELVSGFLKAVGTDPVSGEPDVGRIDGSHTSMHRKHIGIIEHLMKEAGPEGIHVDNLQIAAKEKGITADLFDKVWSKLRISGDIHEWKSGYWRMI